MVAEPPRCFSLRTRSRQTQPGGRRADQACGAEGSLAGCGGARAARSKTSSKTCGARAAGQASARLAPRVARTLASAHLAARIARTPQTQPPGGRRAEACGATGRSAPARSNAAWLWSFAKEPSADARSRALPRSYDRAWARRAGAPAPYRLHAAAPTLGQALGRGRPNSPFGVRARRPGWAGTLRAGERASPMTSRENPARSHGNPMTRAQR